MRVVTPPKVATVKAVFMSNIMKKETCPGPRGALRQQKRAWPELPRKRRRGIWVVMHQHTL